MRILTVVAEAFGPLHDKTLELAKGMTVIYGPNESGKSAWHAALYAGLCGVRRGAGLRKEDREFRERHRPWKGGDWHASVRVELEDGRTIELKHDLEQGTASAIDIDLGRDVASEIVFDGAPDGSGWLGLDRRSFVATACVRQADILGIIEDPDQLQEHLQKAVDTGGADETAARAIVLIDVFQREYVGRDTRASIRPLRRAKVLLETATSGLNDAQQAHEEFQVLEAGAQELREKADEAEAELRRAEGEEAGRTLEHFVAQYGRAFELSERFAEGEPIGPAGGAALVQDVASAISGWEDLPTAPTLDGVSADELKAEFAQLPELPDGDLEIASDVAEAEQRLSSARSTLEAYAATQPEVCALPATGGLSESELRGLAHELETRIPNVEAGFRRQFETASAYRASESGTLQLGLASGVVGLVVGVVMLAVDLTPVGLTLVVLGSVAGMAFGVLELRRRSTRQRLQDEYHGLKSRMDLLELQASDARARLETARGRSESLELPLEPQELRVRAEALAEHRQKETDHSRWMKEHERSVANVESAEGRLRDFLVRRDVDGEGDPLVAFQAYKADCSRRAEIARKAARRPDLASLIKEREALENEAQGARSRRTRAKERLGASARLCGVAASEPETIVVGLKAWQADHLRSFQRYEEEQKGWAELQALLLEGTLEALDEECSRAREAAHLYDDVGGIEEHTTTPDNPEDFLRGLREAAQAAETEVASAEGEARERAKQVASIPAMEEGVEAARTELERVEALGATLNKTLEFLRNAEQKVHRTIAPQLAKEIERWLAAVTAGRYKQVTVDPETLEVRVYAPDGEFRRAASLSHGTREQIYLLLRVAVAKHLTAPGETCPMILDDVTVHSDSHRTRRILETLHTIGTEQQVVLFTQEQDVREWARNNLRDERNRLVELSAEELSADWRDVNEAAKKRSDDDEVVQRPPLEAPPPRNSSGETDLEGDTTNRR